MIQSPKALGAFTSSASYPDRNITSYIVEHLDPELGPWSTLEYRSIAQESAEAGARFILSSVPKVLSLPSELRNTGTAIIEHLSVEELFENDQERICLLDPAALVELSPEDGTRFDVFLFGGILGMLSIWNEGSWLTFRTRR